MLARSSFKRLANSICYPMSSKKTTQQWRKPIEQLKQQKQQATPIPADADQKKKAAMEFYEKEYFSKHKQRLEDLNVSKEKKIWKKKGQNQQEGEQTAGQQPQQQSKPRVSEVNWLEMTQIKQIKELTELVNEALNMSRLKYIPELKEIIIQTKTKFGDQEADYLLNALLKNNFKQMFDSFKQLELEITKMNPKMVSTVLFSLIHMEEYEKVENLLKQLKDAKFQVEPRQQEFFEMLFFKETSQQLPFEYGQSSVHISNFIIMLGSQNRNFVKKLEITSIYLFVIDKQIKSKRSLKVKALPLWLNQSSNIVMRYRFGRKQFSKILTNVMTYHDYLLPENFLQTAQFSLLAREFFFGYQKSLTTLTRFIEHGINKNVKFSTFYKNFTESLMHYRTQHGKSAFQVDQELIEAYKRGFELNKKYLSIMAVVIAADARYVDLAEHYLKFYMQGFPNQTLTSDDTKFVEECVLNNYNSLKDTETHEKLMTRWTKQGHSLMVRLKAAIKLGNLTLAYKLFEEQTFKKAVIQKQRKNIEFVLRNQLGNYSSYFKVKEINEFIQKLDDAYLWSLYQKSQDVSVMLQKFIPEDKFSFWEEQQKKQLFEEMSKKYSRGDLQHIKQPLSDIEATGFNLEQYITNEFPQLRELEAQEYEKEKEMIKYTLRIEGLIEFQKVHSDDLVIEKLTDFLAQLSEESLQILESFGLRDYDIKEWGWEDYVKRFNKMKGQRNMQKFERLDWSGYIKFIEKNKELNKKSVIQQMMIKAPEIFKEAEALVKLDEDPIVNKLLLWGVYTNEPMAIYLGQKLAMQTGQVIPHEIALKVGRMLSYKRPMSEQFIQRCKDCLRIVGKIDRQFIYLFDKEYEHILQRKNFTDYVMQKIEDKKNDHRELEDLVAFSPRQYLDQGDVKLWKESIASRVL